MLTTLNLLDFIFCISSMKGMTCGGHYVFSFGGTKDHHNGLQLGDPCCQALYRRYINCNGYR